MVMREVRIFPDAPIAGMKGNKEAVYVTLDYAFDDYTIHVENVFAWRDSETGKEYIPGDLGVFIDDEVQRFAASIERYLTEQRERPANVRDFSFRLPPPEMATASA